MKYVGIIVLFLGFSDSVQAGNDKVGNKVFGAEAEDIIFEGTVIDISSNDSPYGVKYYYSVLYYGHKWACEQATHRTACYLQK